MEHFLSEVGFPQEADLMQCGVSTGQTCLGNWVLSPPRSVSPSSAVCLTGDWHADLNDKAGLKCGAMKHIISIV